jgi:hypothetical protein
MNGTELGLTDLDDLLVYCQPICPICKQKITEHTELQDFGE